MLHILGVYNSLMELGLCLTCQTLRRAGKRFVVSKLSSNNFNDTKRNTVCSGEEQKIRNQGPAITVKPAGSVLKAPGIKMSQSVLITRTCLSHDILLTRVRDFSQHCVHIPVRKLHTVTTKEWINQSEIVEVLEAAGLPYKKRYTSYETICKSCLDNNSIDVTKAGSLTMLINSRNGENICRSCGVTSTWEDFKKNMKMSSYSKSDTLEPPQIDIIEIGNELSDDWVDWAQAVRHKTLNEVGTAELSGLKINESTLNAFHVGCVVEEGCCSLLFPYYDITRTRLVALKKYDIASQKWSVLKKQKQLSLFGWKNVRDEGKKVVLTSNEFDCLAITQATGIPSLALPLGASTLPPECLPYLEQFDEILMWYRNEYQARQNIHRFAAKLSLSRCFMVSSSSAAYDILNKYGDEAVEKLLQSAHPLSHDHIITFKELSSELYSDLMNTKQNAGIPFTRFPVLNEYLRGHRRGELTIFTGPTGSGKTTFLSELSLDLCMQGVRTLWGSFEIKNIRLANIMMHQLSGLALENHMNKYDDWSEEFEALPMYLMNYYGATELKQVIETIKYAVYTYDIEHVIIDNLQFMTTVASGEDRFQLMDKAIAEFRKCASDYNVHITVVVHPRKENDGSMLQTASIYGSAKASQEADNVLILQNSDKLSMQVSKNRFCGSIGIIPLSFHPESLCLSGFHRNVATGEAILPALKVKRPVQNLKIVRKPQKQP